MWDDLSIPPSLDPATLAYYISELIEAKKSVDEARYAMAAMYALQVYEWISGAQKEYRLIYKARWTSIKTLYLLCRYYPLILWPIVMWAYVGNHDADTCYRVAHPVHALLAPCQFFSQAVMMMRAYAFSGRSKKILVLLGFCYLCLLGTDIWVFCTQVDVPPRDFYLVQGGSGCFPNYGDGFMALRIGWHNKSQPRSQLAAILMDLVSLVVVVIQCQRMRGRDVSLGTYFVNQGLSAFIFVALVNIGAAIAFFRPPRFHTGIGLPLILVVSNLMNVIVFFLDILTYFNEQYFQNSTATSTGYTNANRAITAAFQFSAACTRGPTTNRNRFVEVDYRIYLSYSFRFLHSFF
ncbi:hypothetical protein CVT24_010066 [Panaeolus cyanescens]|uniref:DUF6533 domain-containing protein n=1 Tax=Panaeolus cyanescens TaxID=181874 RepID=A0A409W9D7_9AGAR|nr:hypothetical protein CVT24_010066 [Panaeolus cyanescens]